MEHERIKTTLVKAKELRRHAEKAITLGKKEPLHAFRLLYSHYPQKQTVKKIIKELSPRFKDRPGGYTRIVKLGARDGDGAEMAFLEFVDYDFEKKYEERKKQDSNRKEKKKISKTRWKSLKKRRKDLRKIQQKDRVTNRRP